MGRTLGVRRSGERRGQQSSWAFSAVMREWREVRAFAGTQPTLRLDKFLQVSRLIKRRELAKAACAQDRVSLNGREAKGGDRVKVGDRIILHGGGRHLTVEVVAIKERARADEARELYLILDDGPSGPGT